MRSYPKVDFLLYNKVILKTCQELLEGQRYTFFF